MPNETIQVTLKTFAQLRELRGVDLSLIHI